MCSDAAGAATRELERPAAGDASVPRAVPPGTRPRALALTVPEALAKSVVFFTTQKEFFFTKKDIYT